MFRKAQTKITEAALIFILSESIQDCEPTAESIAKRAILTLRGLGLLDSEKIDPGASSCV